MLCDHFPLYLHPTLGWWQRSSRDLDCVLLQYQPFGRNHSNLSAILKHTTRVQFKIHCSSILPLVCRLIEVLSQGSKANIK